MTISKKRFRKIYFFLLGFTLFITFSIYSLTTPLLKQVNRVEVNIPVNENRLYADVDFLASIYPYRNAENINSLNKAAEYIYNEFKKLDFKPYYQEFKVDTTTYKNVIASYGSKDAERIIVGAHYDACDHQSGADDNASGVAGVLELARLFNELKPDIKYRIDFVTYTLEEPPFFRTEQMGSAIHAQSLADSNIRVKLMVCLEMIGYFSDKPNSQEFPTKLIKPFYPKTGNFIAVIGKTGQDKPIRKFKRSMKEVSNIDVRSISAPKFVPGIDFSDHLNYWNKGFKAIMINNTAFYRNKNYHEKTDTIETLDFKRMAEVVKGVYWALVNY